MCEIEKAKVLTAIVEYGKANGWETDEEHAKQAVNDMFRFGCDTRPERVNCSKLDLLYNIYYA